MTCAFSSATKSAALLAVAWRKVVMLAVAPSRNRRTGRAGSTGCGAGREGARRLRRGCCVRGFPPCLRGSLAETMD